MHRALRSTLYGLLCIGVCVLLIADIAASSHVVPAFDELLWTKAQWAKWKIPSSVANLNPVELEGTVGLHAAYPELRTAAWSSLQGPVQRALSGSQQHVLGGAGQPFDDEQHMLPAGQAVRCTVCQTLVAKVWHRLVLSALRGELTVRPTPDTVQQHMSNVCDKQILSLLSKVVLYRLEVENQLQQMVFFVLRKREPGSTPTMHERAAVTHACKSLVAEAGPELAGVLSTHAASFQAVVKSLLVKHGLAGTLQLQQQQQANPEDSSTAVSSEGGEAVDIRGQGPSGGRGGDDGGVSAQNTESEGAAVGAPMATAKRARTSLDTGDEDVAKLVKQLLRGLAQRLQLQGVLVVQRQDGTQIAELRPGDDSDESDSEGGDDEYADPDDELMGEDEDEDDVDCMDLHPKCVQWADAGECMANPIYMVGDGDAHKGHCKKACGRCTPQVTETPALLKEHPELTKDVTQASQTLLQAARQLACGVKQGCLTDASSIAKAGNVVLSNRPAVPAYSQHNGAFVLGKPSVGIPRLQETAASREHLQQLLAKARAAQAAPSDVAAEAADTKAAVTAVLQGELGGKLLLLPADFFTFELLWKNHTRHWHAEADGKLTEDWWLGSFARESVLMTDAAGAPAALDSLDLLPDMSDIMSSKRWPYVKQVYLDGDICHLAGGRQVPRRTEVRYACSPDNNLHFLVREPDFCQYVFVVYTPGMCSVAAYQPVPVLGS